MDYLDVIVVYSVGLVSVLDIGSHYQKRPSRTLAFTLSPPSYAKRFSEGNITFDNFPFKPASTWTLSISQGLWPRSPLGVESIKISVIEKIHFYYFEPVHCRSTVGALRQRVFISPLIPFRRDLKADPLTVYMLGFMIDSCRTSRS